MSERAASEGRPSQLPGLWVLIRDIGTWVGGWVLTFMEVSRPEIRESVLVLCGSLIAVPGAAVGIGALRRRAAGTTDDSPSSPQSAEAQP